MKKFNKYGVVLFTIALALFDRDSSVAIAVLRVTILRIDFSVKCLHFARHFSLHVIHGEIVSQR